MSDPFTNLLQATGRTMPEWFAVVGSSGLDRHAEIVRWLKTEHGLTHGFANGIALQYRSRGASSDDADLVAAQYTGAKAALLPVYEAVVVAATSFGADVEVAPKRTGVSLRRSKQFALVQAPSAKRVRLGIQLPGEPTTDRLLAGDAMCSHRVDLAAVEDVDDELVGWLLRAYQRA